MLGKWVITVAMAAGLQAAPRHAEVAGGEEVAVCAWPTVVRVGGCSGTLIHPEVVLYAAHCGTGASNVLFGEDENTATAVAVQSCQSNPDWSGSPGGDDFAFCRLAEPVQDVPIAPILMGCEIPVLQAGAEIVSVGWGSAPGGSAGIKRAVTYQINAVNEADNFVNAGGGGLSLCGGDSGGGSFIRSTDGSWRVFAVNSAVQGEVCGDGTPILAIMAAAVPWIEDATGLDVSPCHDALGNWDPGPDCKDAPLDPETGGGAWPACETGPLSGPLSTCGPPAEGPDDLQAPTVAIVTPEDGTHYPLDVRPTASVEVTFTVDDADGWGIDRTFLRIDGMDIGASEDDFPPYEVSGLSMPEGVYDLQMVARDWAGNEGVSDPVTIIVGDPPLGTTSGTGDTGDTSTGGGEPATSGTGPGPGDTTAGPPPDDGSTGMASGGTGLPQEEGEIVDPHTTLCGCRADPQSAWWVLPLLVGISRRRGRRAA